MTLACLYKLWNGTSLFAKWSRLDEICQCWKLSDDFTDLFAHVNLMLDIVFDVQKVAEMERGLVCLQKYLVSYHDFFARCSRNKKIS